MLLRIVYCNKVQLNESRSFIYELTVRHVNSR